MKKKRKKKQNELLPRARARERERERERERAQQPIWAGARLHPTAASLPPRRTQPNPRPRKSTASGVDRDPARKSEDLHRARRPRSDHARVRAGRRAGRRGGIRGRDDTNEQDGWGEQRRTAGNRVPSFFLIFASASASASSPPRRTMS